MATKTKTKPKARARTAPAQVPTPNNAAPAPAAQAAPEPAAVVMERPGLRTPSVWSPRDRNPRPVGELTRTATLIRGNVYVISYSDAPLNFRYGVSVPINESEFERLSAAVDRIDFQDPANNARTIRAIRKFRFEDSATGDPIEMPPIPDVEGGPLARDAFEEVEHERRFQGQEHTAR